MLRRESDIETEVKNGTVLLAYELGVPIYFLKLNVLGMRGWPDRLLFWPYGNLMFIEFKRPGEEPRKLQQWIHKNLRDIGFEVQVHDDAARALESIKAYILATFSPATSDGPHDEERRGPDIPEAGAGEDGVQPEGIPTP